MTRWAIAPCSFLLGAALLAALPEPAHAITDAEVCKQVKVCKTITPPCPNQYHRPCKPPYVKCEWVKKCPGD
jgi:hypothetical protein